MADLLSNPIAAFAAFVALVVVPRLGSLAKAIPWSTIRAWLANEEPALDTTPELEPEHGPLELREHWRCLRSACEDAGEADAVKALDGDVADALGRLYIRPEVKP